MSTTAQNWLSTYLWLQISEDVHSGFLHHGKQVTIILQEAFQSIKNTILVDVNTSELLFTFKVKHSLTSQWETNLSPFHIPHVLSFKLQVFPNDLTATRICHSRVKVIKGQHTGNINDGQASENTARNFYGFSFKIHERVCPRKISPMFPKEAYPQCFCWTMPILARSILSQDILGNRTRRCN